MDCITKKHLMLGRKMFAPGSHVQLEQEEYLRLRAGGVVESAEEHKVRADYQAHLASIEAEAQAAAAEVRKKIAGEAAEAKSEAKAAPPKGKAAKRGPALSPLPEDKSANADD